MKIIKFLSIIGALEVFSCAFSSMVMHETPWSNDYYRDNELRSLLNDQSRYGVREPQRVRLVPKKKKSVYQTIPSVGARPFKNDKKRTSGKFNGSHQGKQSFR